MKYTITELRDINNSKIEELKKYNNDNKKLEIQLAIRNILNQKNCFFNMDANTSIDLLTNLIEKDSIKETYLELINSQNFRKNNNIA